MSVLKDAAQYVKYKDGAGRDLIDIEAQAKFSALQHSCDYDDGNVTVNLNLDIIVERGPASASSRIAVPYFVAIVDAQQNVLAKRVFQNPIDFPADRRRIGIREETEQTIPLRGSESGASYEIVIGFQLERDQLDENRRRSR